MAELVLYSFASVIAVSMVLLLMRCFVGPSVFDRLLSVNIFGTNLVVLIVLLAFIQEDYNYIDIALVYAFLNFVGTIAILRFYKFGGFRSNKSLLYGDESNEHD